MKITKQDLDLPHKQFLELINTHLGRETTNEEGLHPNPKNLLTSQEKGGFCPPLHQHITNHESYYYIANHLEQQRIPPCSIMINGETETP